MCSLEDSKRKQKDKIVLNEEIKEVEKEINKLYYRIYYNKVKKNQDLPQLVRMFVECNLAEYKVLLRQDIETLVGQITSADMLINFWQRVNNTEIRNIIYDQLIILLGERKPISKKKQNIFLLMLDVHRNGKH